MFIVCLHTKYNAIFLFHSKKKKKKKKTRIGRRKDLATDVYKHIFTIKEFFLADAANPVYLSDEQMMAIVEEAVSLFRINNNAFRTLEERRVFSIWIHCLK